MLERHDARPGRAKTRLSSNQHKASSLRPGTDREVPLPRATQSPMGDMPVVVQEWLDGEVGERTARSVDDGSVRLWNRIAAETGRRRRMETPAQMSDRIMAVLPEKVPMTGDVLFRPFGVRPITAILCAAVLLAAGAMVGELVRK
jgi:hypothetical protein